jgi:3'(2'), 5'-bisphosphate nucleotidase
MSNQDPDYLLLLAIQSAFIAGKSIMKVYGEEQLVIKRKKDFSPLTLADQSAHEVIMKLLEPTNIPVISEEGHQYDYEVRKNWEYFWLVDPLDGTKEFLKRNGEFTVNIALIEHNLPIIGIVCAPAVNQLYWASQEHGSYILNTNVLRERLEIDIPHLIGLSEKLPFSRAREFITVVASRSHINFLTNNYIKHLKKKHGKVDVLSKGSSLKFCIVAEGSADIYPRFGPTMEWDTAAGQAVAVFSGCKVTRYDTGTILTYNKKDLHNPLFIVSRDRII